MAKFQVTVKTNEFGPVSERMLHIFANSENEAKQLIQDNGIGFDGQKTVYPLEITEVKQI